MFGLKVSNSTKTVWPFPFLSLTPNIHCQPLFSGRTAWPVCAGSSVLTFIRKVNELSVQVVKGSPTLMYWIVSSPWVGSFGMLPATEPEATVRNGAEQELPPPNGGTKLTYWQCPLSPLALTAVT